MISPTFFEEELLWKKGYTYVCGIDEVGRGALAGPVVAAAVIFPVYFNHSIELRDSKLLSALQRERFSKEIRKEALGIGIGSATSMEIDSIGIVEATHLAMTKAIQQLPFIPHFILIDGREKLSVFKSSIQKSIIKGDQKVCSISAASIIAKVYRDSLMQEMHRQFIWYGFDRNVGYGTEKHLRHIKKFGVSSVHRRTFIPSHLWEVVL